MVKIQKKMKELCDYHPIVNINIFEHFGIGQSIKIENKNKEEDKKNDNLIMVNGDEDKKKENNINSMNEFEDNKENNSLNKYTQKEETDFVQHQQTFEKQKNKRLLKPRLLPLYK